MAIGKTTRSDANAAFVWVLCDGSSNANRRSVVNLRQIGAPAWFQTIIAPFAWRDLFIPDAILSGGSAIDFPTPIEETVFDHAVTGVHSNR